MRVLILFSVLIIGCSPGAPEPEAEPKDERIMPVLAGRLENRDIDEASGIARSQATPGVYWIINDSGKPRLHPIDARGQALGRVKLDGAGLSDWEDMVLLDQIYKEHSPRKAKTDGDELGEN